jgi:hypothetical protein
LGNLLLQFPGWCAESSDFWLSRSASFAFWYFADAVQMALPSWALWSRKEFFGHELPAFSAAMRRC